MSAPIVVPFNFQPAATGARASGTYTVTANRYAWVTVTAQDGGSATLNGTEIITSQSDTQGSATRTAYENDGSASESNGSSGGTTTIYTIPANNYFHGQLWFDFSTSDGAELDLRVSGTTFYRTSTPGAYDFRGVIVGESDAIQINLDAGGSVQWGVSGVLFSDNETGNDQTATSNTISFWAKAGDAIAISGNANIVYAEYDNLS